MALQTAAATEEYRMGGFHERFGYAETYRIPHNGIVGGHDRLKDRVYFHQLQSTSLHLFVLICLRFVANG